MSTLGAGDKIHYADGKIAIVEVAAEAAEGTASIATTGLASFATADTSLAARLGAVAKALGATPTAGSAAVFTLASGSTTDSYIFISDAEANLTDGDIVIKVTGVAATGLTITENDITAITIAGA